VSSEDLYRARGPDVFQLVEEAVFRAQPAEVGPIGKETTRAGIVRADLLQFFQRAYSTRNTTLVLAGAVTVDEARALVDRAVLLPPALPEERLAPLPVSPALPARSTVRAGYLAATVGYPLRPADRDACEPLAELLELRIMTALCLRAPVVREVAVTCNLLRGNPFILATAYGPTIEATDLPARIERFFEDAAARPPDARERRLLQRRRIRRAEQRSLDAVARVDALAREAARPRVDGPTPLVSGEAGPLPGRAMQAAARWAFRPERRVLLFISPFEGKHAPAEGEDGVQDE
jgi:hypothetical protein